MASAHPVLDDTVLVVPELVTNAIVHAPGADSDELAVELADENIGLSLADGSSIAQ